MADLGNIEVGDHVAKINTHQHRRIDGYEIVVNVCKKYFETPTGKWRFDGSHCGYSRLGSDHREIWTNDHNREMDEQRDEDLRCSLSREFGEYSVWKGRPLELLKKVKTLLDEDDARQAKENDDGKEN